MPLMTTQLLAGRYRIVNLLGQGGMGAVYLAEDTHLAGQYCAIKENIPDPNASPQVLAQLRQQFKVEANILASFDHANLPKVSDYFSDAGNEYLVMDYIKGDDLETVLQKHGRPLSEKLVLPWANQVLSALDYLHTRQPHPIIHRDIKPANIILTQQNTVKLVDFGLVKLLDSQNPRTVAVMKGMGTAEYTPLEQYATTQGHTDARTDIYALGATLYHLLTNVAPPDAHQQFIDPSKLVPPRQYNSTLSARTEAAILKAMAMQSDQRFQSAQAFQAALAAAYQTIVLPPSPAPIGGGRASSAKSAHQSRLLGLLWGMLGTILTLLVILLFFQLQKQFLVAALTPVTSTLTPVTSSITVGPTVTSSLITGLPTETSILLLTPSPVPCRWNLEFVADVTIPDRTTVEAGGTFMKVWRVLNSGTCAWNSSQIILFFEGQQLGPPSAPVPAIEPGQEADISMEMVAPTTPGRYNGTWQVMDVDGQPFGHLTVMIDVPGASVPTVKATIAPSGGSRSRIAFMSDRDGNKEIYVMNTDGSGLTRLTYHDAEDKRPAPSPDGTRLAFQSLRDGNWEIYRMNSDGSGLTRLTNHIANDEGPNWSSSGKLLFQSNRTRKWDIYEMQADGSQIFNLTNSPALELDPSWSPNGRQIAFTFSEVYGEPSELYLMNADGRGWTRLTNNSSSDIEPVWSPDGQRIAFASPPKRGDDFDIYIMNVDGSGVRNLSNNPVNDIHPAWSPDGRQIAFVSYREGNWEIYIMNSDGSGLRNLSNHWAADQWPAWLP